MYIQSPLCNIYGKMIKKYRICRNSIDKTGIMLYTFVIDTYLYFAIRMNKNDKG